VLPGGSAGAGNGFELRGVIGSIQTREIYGKIGEPNLERVKHADSPFDRIKATLARILFIHDEPVTAYAVRSALERQGHVVMLLSSLGVQADQQSRDVDIVVSASKIRPNLDVELIHLGVDTPEIFTPNDVMNAIDATLLRGAGAA
jgi:hypothetical protein